MFKPSITRAYEVARLVYLGGLKPGAGAKRLETDHGFNVNSARDIIMVYRQLMRGESFKRGLSAPDMDYFLSRIAADDGPVALRTAIDSLWLHLGYYEGIRNVTMRTLRGIAANHQAHAATPESIENLNTNFKAAVQRSLEDSSLLRLQRLATASKVPTRRLLLVLAFGRNPDVVAEVLLRATGKCERCHKAAPFMRRKNKSPYLEVHHIKHLADDGEDTVQNAIALCPNCHRELHHGEAET